MVSQMYSSVFVWVCVCVWVWVWVCLCVCRCVSVTNVARAHTHTHTLTHNYMKNKWFKLIIHFKDKFSLCNIFRFRIDSNQNVTLLKNLEFFQF